MNRRRPLKPLEEHVGVCQKATNMLLRIIQMPKSRAKWIRYGVPLLKERIRGMGGLSRWHNTPKAELTAAHRCRCGQGQRKEGAPYRWEVWDCRRRSRANLLSKGYQKSAAAIVAAGRNARPVKGQTWNGLSAIRSFCRS